MNPDRPPAPGPGGGVALVTGGARRIGAAIVRALHAAGLDVVVHHHHSTAAAQALAAELGAARPGSAILARADLCVAGAAESLIGEVEHRCGRLDVLVNNASTFYPTPVGAITEAQWADLVGTNLRAPLFLAQAAAALLRRHRGCIVNLADIHGERPLRAHCVYSAAKAALLMLTRSLAIELGPEIRVNAVSPGPILWPEQPLEDSARRAIIESTALKRVGDPGDIAAAVVFLAREAGYVTGQNLSVDGGRSAGGY